MGPTLLITTLNRPEELRRCVKSVVEQTMLPEELVVIDASDGLRASLEDLIRPTTIRLVHLPASRGRTRQLNIGIRTARGDPVIIVDDDTVLEPGFVEAMVTAFERGGPQVGAIEGTMMNGTYATHAFRLLRTLFLLPQHTKDSPGKLHRSGYYTIPAQPAEPTESEAVTLTATAFRRHVLVEFGLDESLDGYALKEDIDLSYRISRRYRVLVIPDARYHHLKTPTARIGVREKARMHIVNNFWFFSKHKRGSIVNDVAFAWSLVGRIGLQICRAVTKRDPRYVLGTLDGFVDVLRNRQPKAVRDVSPDAGVVKELETSRLRDSRGRPGRRHRVSRRGLTVALIGPDGAGKSTLAQALQRQFVVPVKIVYMGIHRSASRSASARPMPLPVRLLVNWVRYLIAELHADRGELVVYDRFPFDALLPAAARQSLPRRIGRWAIAHACPRPDLVIVLDAPANVMHRRKPDHPIEVLERRRQQYLRLRFAVPGLRVVDAGQSPDDLRRSVTALIYEAHDGRRGSARSSEAATDHSDVSAQAPASARRS